MWLLKVDNAEYALLTVIVIFSGEWRGFPREASRCYLLLQTLKKVKN